MPDMLVKLYKLPVLSPVIDQLSASGIHIRRVCLAEKLVLCEWVQAHFGLTWARGCEIALEQRPVSCYLAVESDHPIVSASMPDDDRYDLLVGFALYDVASKGMFGPIGVREDYQGRGIGKALLLRCLHTMADDGYAYAIIGAVGPAEFYEKTVGATIIEESDLRVVRRKLHG